MPKLSLPRDLIAKIAQGNALAIRQLEKVFGDVDSTLPTTIEEANALAGSALSVAQTTLASLMLLTEALEQLSIAPSMPPHVEADDVAPRVQLGTITSQNADSVEITGGSIDNTPIGLTTAADAKFKKVSTSDQITSTVAPGAPPLVIASTDKVVNLYADRAASADTAVNLGTAGTYPADATDLASVITLANYIKSRNISKGV